MCEWQLVIKSEKPNNFLKLLGFFTDLILNIFWAKREIASIKTNLQFLTF